MPSECPYENEVRTMRDDLKATKLKVGSLQAKYDLLTIAQIKEEAEKCGTLRGLRIAAMVIGYLIIAIVFMMVGHAVGFVELIARVLKL